MALTAPRYSLHLGLITQRLTQEVSPVIFRNWFLSLSYEVEGSNLNVLTTDEFHTERIKRDYLPLMQKVVSEVFPSMFSHIAVKKKPISISQAPVVVMTPMGQEGAQA